MFYSYLKTFNRLELKAIPMAQTQDYWRIFHMVIILAETGESDIYADKNIFEIDPDKLI